ncbi:hypothetical protein VOI32_16535 [Paraburkholderia caribensis]|uniref:Uncharacterized protein n=2 Tax=Paraburkholderia caribensis TaxID=75105 RepID=A0ABV0DWK7_9BURK|nr:hypothetical protein [Paraburkholderia caribensis]
MRIRACGTLNPPRFPRQASRSPSQPTLKSARPRCAEMRIQHAANCQDARILAFYIRATDRLQHAGCATFPVRRQTARSRFGFGVFQHCLARCIVRNLVRVFVRALFAYVLKETCRHTASRNPTGSAALSNHARRALQAGCFYHPCLPM